MKCSAKNRLLYWLITQKNQGNDVVLTSSIGSWGSTHFSNRAMRNARELCNEGEIERSTRKEMIELGIHHVKESAYRIK